MSIQKETDSELKITFSRGGVNPPSSLQIVTEKIFNLLKEWDAEKSTPEEPALEVVEWDEKDKTNVTTFVKMILKGESPGESHLYAEILRAARIFNSAKNIWREDISSQTRENYNLAVNFIVCLACAFLNSEGKILMDHLCEWSGKGTICTVCGAQ